MASFAPPGLETATDNTTGLAAQMAYLLLLLSRPDYFSSGICRSLRTIRRSCIKYFFCCKALCRPIQSAGHSRYSSCQRGGDRLQRSARKRRHYRRHLFRDRFIATISRALSETHGVREDAHWWSKYIISFLLLFWFGILILFPLTLWSSAKRSLELQKSISAHHPIAAMGCRVKFALHRTGADRPGASALSPDAGELSHDSSSVAGCDFFPSADYRDQTLSGLRGKI